jgi:hypothetical protein
MADERPVKAAVVQHADVPPGVARIESSVLDTGARTKVGAADELNRHV